MDNKYENITERIFFTQRDKNGFCILPLLPGNSSKIKIILKYP
jgi:hypothetical protein